MTLNSTAAKVDFTQDLNVFETLLNTDSLRKFYEAYETENLSAMQNHFMFHSWAQVELFHDYLEDMVEHFLVQNATYDIIALSSLMAKNFDPTALPGLIESMPINVCSRVMASYFKANSVTC